MMDLPKKHLKSTRGQILILFLLVLVVGVAIVLSVASRTITDIRTTTTSDESNRAYFAAEAGIEEALQQLQGGGAIPATGLDINFPAVNTSAETVDVTSTMPTPTTFIYPDNLARDDVAQAVLLNDFNNPSSGSPVPNSLNFFWGSDSTIAVTTPAIEVTVVYCVGVGGPPPAACPAAPEFKLVKFTFDPYTARPGTNNFCTGVDKTGADLTDSLSGLNRHFAFKRSIDIVNGELGGCRGGSPPVVGGGSPPVVEGIGAGNTPVLARIRLLYNPNPEPVAVTVDSGHLPSQGAIIESTGTTPSGVTRKLQVTRLYPALPALFDYVLFSGQDLAK